LTRYNDQLEVAKRLTKTLETLAELEALRDRLILMLGGAEVAPIEEPKVSPEIIEYIASKYPTKEVREPEPEEPKQTPAEAMAVYDAAMPKITESQARMIFGMLTRDHGIVPVEDKKAIIHGIVKEEHGVEIESTKELSKVWAGDVITHIQKAKTEDLMKYLEKVEPF